MKQRSLFHRTHPRPAAGAGFTYVELMVALAVGLLIMAVVYEMLLQAGQLSSVSDTRTELNSASREIVELIVDGGIVDVSPKNTIDDNDVFEGLHGAANIDVDGSGNVDLEPSELGMTITREGQRLEITDGSDSVLSGAKDVTIDCPAAGVPHPDCTAGDTGLNGFLAEPPVVEVEIQTPTSRCGALLTRNDAAAVSVSMSLLEPRALFRFEEFNSADYTFNIETSASLNLDCRT